MKPIFIVTSGCYSDYGIDAVCSTRAGAEAFVEAAKLTGGYRAADTRIEVWPIDDLSHREEGQKKIKVVLSENGDTDTVTEMPPDARLDWYRWSRSAGGPRFPHLGPQKVTFGATVWARDTDHAIKMARDARAASVAAGDLERLRGDPADHWVHVDASL